MRTYANYEQLQLWRGHPELRASLRAGNVTALRFQPVMRQQLPLSVVDVTVRCTRGYVSVPAVLVDSPQLVAEEKDPLVWPAAIAHALDEQRAREFHDLIVPWLRALGLGRGLNRELIRHSGTDADRRAFEAARALRYPGAALTEDAATALGPYVYASRYAAGKRIAVLDLADGAQGAAYLSYFGRVSARLPRDAADVASHWFEPFGAPDATADVIVAPRAQSAVAGAVQILVETEDPQSGIVRVISQAYPMDVLFTNQTLNGPPVRSFTVAAPDVAVPERGLVLPPHVPSGGSAGRILIGLREDFERAPDSDSESALELAALLRSEGLTVDVSGRAERCDFGAYDVVHVFNLVECNNALQFLLRARNAGVRTVLTATFEDASDERTWGFSTAQNPLREAIDETGVERYIGFLERRALLAPGWETRSRVGPVPNYDAMVAQALALSDVVIAETQAEAELLRTVFKRNAGLVVIPPALRTARAASNPLPAAPGRFVLMHAPLEPRNNHVLALRGARRAGMDVVLAGELRDMEFAARIREAAGVRVHLVEQPTQAELDWLYQSAAVYLDAGWLGYGTARLRRAALAGAALAITQTGWGPALWPGVAAVDPASPKSIAAGIVAARPLGEGDLAATAAQALPGGVLRNVIGAYLGQLAGTPGG